MAAGLWLQDVGPQLDNPGPLFAGSDERSEFCRDLKVKNRRQGSRWVHRQRTCPNRINARLREVRALKLGIGARPDTGSLKTVLEVFRVRGVEQGPEAIGSTFLFGGLGRVHDGASVYASEPGSSGSRRCNSSHSDARES